MKVLRNLVIIEFNNVIQIKVLRLLLIIKIFGVKYVTF